MADLPGSSGLGSSSAFAAALLYNLTGRIGKKFNSIELAKKIIYIERDLLKESGGYQDQIATTHGGLRLVSYKKNNFEVTKNYLDKDLIKYCKERLLLIRVPTLRLDMEAALKNEKYIQQNLSNQELTELVAKTNQLWDQFTSSSTAAEKFQVIQESIHSSWQAKSKWGNHIISTEVAKIIFKLESLGSHHFKLVGSGGGGFILIAEEPNIISNIPKLFKLEDLVYFELSISGTESLDYE
jgi:D-glycero-alpha-D-manno-heptose-7-phosphate kinase